MKSFRQARIRSTRGNDSRPQNFLPTQTPPLSFRHPARLRAGLQIVASLFLLMAGRVSLAQGQEASSPSVQLPEVNIVANPLDLPTLPFDLPAQVDKSGVPIKDVPRSIVIVPQALFQQQGATLLRDTLPNVSGVSQGGQFAFGFADRIVIRGLDANYLSDGLPDETSELGGIPHSLVGVERVEVLKGPGSALYGSSEPGGSINLVHFQPSDTLSAAMSQQIGSYGTTVTDISATGPTTVPNVDWRVDGEFQNSQGFRDLHNQIGEIMPALRWHPDGHNVILRFDYQHLAFQPDAAGIPFSPPKGTGEPLSVSPEAHYFTPFAQGTQDIVGVFASDSWTITDYLSIDNELSFTNRQVDVLRNAGGSVTLIGSMYELTGRQLRQQNDEINDLVYQFQPVWHFQTGSINHSLVTGFELNRVDAASNRATADLPNIVNIFQPVVPEQSEAALTFKCDAGHSCYNDELWARYYGIYAVDQMDVTDAIKLRLSARQNWFTTAGEAVSSSPVNPGNVYPCSAVATGCPFVPGQPVIRNDAPFSWEAGAVYFIHPALSVFGGYSDGSYPIFNTEEPQTIGQAPEQSQQFELGLRYEVASRLAFQTAIYQATRENVFTLNTIPNPVGQGNIDQAAFFSYRVRGWDSDINLTILNQWRLVANFTLQDPVITQYPQTPTDAGHYVPSVPTVLANFWAIYDFPLREQWGLLQAQLGFRYRNGEYADAGETRFVPGAPLFDIGVAWRRAQYKLTVAARNVLNQRNYLYAAGTGGGAYPGPGRSIFAQLVIGW
jgi:iron complex outermembrane recepter protein